MQRQESVKNQEMIMKFLNFCAIIIQKNVKGYLQRQKHKIIMMHIRRFKAILNGYIQGYRTRQIMKVPDVAKLKQNIIDTDDGTFGNQLIRQKKIKLIKMIDGFLENGQFHKKLKKIKSAKKQFQTNQKPENEFVGIDQRSQQNYYKKQQSQNSKQPFMYPDQMIENEYIEQPQDPYQQYLQQQSMMQENKRIYNDKFDDRPIRQKQENSNFYGDQINDQVFNEDRPISGKGSYEVYEDESTTIQNTMKNNKTNTKTNSKTKFQNQSQQQFEEDRPITSKGNYNQMQDDQFGYAQDERPINQNKKQNNEFIDDDRPIQSKGKYSNYEEEKPIQSQGKYQSYDDDRPIGGKGSYDTFDERPIGGKGSYGIQDDERPIGGKGNYVNQYDDDRPIGGKGSYGIQEDDRPLNGKGTYTNQEDEPTLPKKVVKKKVEPKKKKIEENPAFDNQNENDPPMGKYQQDDDQQDNEKPKPKKKDPKLLENLKKRTKYDPRKAIQEAKKKQEEQQNQEQEEEQPVQQEKDEPPQQKKPVLSSKNLPERQELSPNPKKLNVSATPERQTPKQDIGECSPKDDSDQKPKNFLKRKSKQIPLKNPKVDPKTVKSKVKNCWNANNAYDDPEFDGNEDLPQSPKAYINNKSPSRRFEQKSTEPNYQLQQQLLQQQQQQQQQQLQQQLAGNKSSGPVHVQVQLVQENQIQNIQPNTQMTQQQKRIVIQVDDLERAYYSKYTQKLETTKMNLKPIVQERLQFSGGVPIITSKSRFFTSFRVSDFDRLLSQLEDQYNKLQSSK